MSATYGDMEYYSGYKDGYSSALDDVRHELLTIQADGAIIPLEIFKTLNNLQHPEPTKANLPPCDNFSDLVFNNID